jgi:hypothetical protein
VSGKLAMRVFESGLAPELKPTAVVMALFANDRGERIYPSVDRVSHLLGQTRRAVERKLAELRRLGILLPQAETTGGRLPGGRGRSVMYHLDAAALPSRADYKPRHLGRGSEQENPDACVEVLDPETPAPRSETPTPTTGTPTPVVENPDTQVGRSFRSDLLEGSGRENVSSAGAFAPRARTQDHEEPETETAPSAAVDWSSLEPEEAKAFVQSLLRQRDTLPPMKKGAKPLALLKGTR